MAQKPIEMLGLMAFRFLWCKVNQPVDGVSITHLLCFTKILVLRKVSVSKNENGVDETA